MKKRIITIATVCCLIALCVAGVAYAYLKDTDSKTVVFTSGMVDGTLTTAELPTSSTKVYPCQTFAASPVVAITNDSEDAIAFIEFEYPVNTSVTTYSSNGTALHDGVLFSTVDVDEDWIELDVTPANVPNGYARVVYGYTDRLTSTNKTADAAFDSFQAANFEQSSAVVSGNVRIIADLIQANGISDSDNMAKATLENAYAKFTTNK